MQHSQSTKPAFTSATKNPFAVPNRDAFEAIDPRFASRNAGQYVIVHEGLVLSALNPQGKEEPVLYRSLQAAISASPAFDGTAMIAQLNRPSFHDASLSSRNSANKPYDPADELDYKTSAASQQTGGWSPSPGEIMI